MMIYTSHKSRGFVFAFCLHIDVIVLLVLGVVYHFMFQEFSSGMRKCDVTLKLVLKLNRMKILI